LTNLLGNACKFVAPGVKPVIAVAAEIRAQTVHVSITDNGIGIAPEHHDRIFNVFERLHGQETYAGTGIGLALVRRALERMGGQVGVESRIGAGTRFWFDLRLLKRGLS
jgi:signal transduction histidine kinase